MIWDKELCHGKVTNLMNEKEYIISTVKEGYVPVLLNKQTWVLNHGSI